MTYVTRIFGPPGTGKTTRLLEIVEEALADGVSPEEIAYLSFSTKAAEEAITRATDKFNIEKKRFKYFRTLHSLGFYTQKLRRDEVMDYDDYKSIADALGLEISRALDEDEAYGNKEGDNCRTIVDLSRAKLVTLEQEWRCAELQVTVPYLTVEQFAATVEKYKQKYGKHDFSDMLERYSGGLPVKILIVDEAQDLSKLQWEVVRKASDGVDKVYLAGDDDQAIYSWNGADVDTFLNYNVNEDIILPKSWRVPNSILKLSKSISERITNRKPKEYSPAPHNGHIYRDTYLYDLDLNSGEWLFLFRNKKFCERTERMLEEKGLLYFNNKSGKMERSIKAEEAKLITGWEALRRGETISMGGANAIIKKLNSKLPPLNIDKVTSDNMPFVKSFRMLPWYDVFEKHFYSRKTEYIRSCLRNGQRLTEIPRITISTIHRAKGGESENVVVCPDYSYLSYQFIDSDEERRVQYVALTRAKNNLYLLRPEEEHFYEY